MHHGPYAFCNLFALHVKLSCLESRIHPVLVPLRVGVEIELPVIYARNMDAVAVKLDHVHMIAAIRITVLVFKHGEEYIG